FAPGDKGQHRGSGKWFFWRQEAKNSDMFRQLAPGDKWQQMLRKAVQQGHMWQSYSIF
ncbi:hypothetical protein A2U01_0081406, partial [Trifolium medium]|nr:hypothetical protein [Trifolium medium]